MQKNICKLFVALVCLLASLPAAAADGGDVNFNSQRTDFRDETIYFMITTRFYDGDPSNNVLCWDNQQCQIETGDPCWRGDFQGVIDRLDYIKALGFTAIWITPVVQNASGYDYHGYHASDFTRVDCRYQSGDGRKSGDAMFQELIDKAHAKGIKIILDVVFNHTGNFGEETLCKEFTRNTSLRNQASIDACMVPDASKLGSDYLSIAGAQQYARRLALMKNTDGQNHDTHNYWHHVGNDWNWDYPSRWWGQIAGDCVDLNTENDAVAEYLVRCYSQFIKMGVDGFRIDTSGHISRLTFNKVFIPQLAAVGEQYKSRRLNGAPFFMYGEVCARYSEVQYREQDCLSPYFYTWQSPSTLLDAWNSDASWWDRQVVHEGAQPLGNMTLCLKDVAASPTTDNAFLLNGAYHEPDHSQASGFNVIDFPLHYNFTSAARAYSLAKDGDAHYNDATYNVVYVDSHDYGPQPNDGVRFAGNDDQWAENLSLMFTFRGIPCIYYGSEVGFRRGVTIDRGPNGPLSQTGRAYFGGYITGSVSATDFGSYTASGNVSATLRHDLAQHLIRLNKIRQAVPALRKGQWSDSGCTPSGNGIAFKRAYKDSYALVALNGGATFTGCPQGSYTDLVTGEKLSGTTITVKAPATKGQVRVLVKDWDGGQIGSDGPFIYATSPKHLDGQAYDGNEEAGTTTYFTEADAVALASVSLNPGGGSFRTPTLSVTATLADDAQSGWYSIGGGARVALAPGESRTFVIGADMAYGESKTVEWGATNGEGTENTGSATYTKADPSTPAFCAYFAAPASWTTVKAWVWDATNGNRNYTGGTWPGELCVKTADTYQGLAIWKWEYQGSLTAMPTHIIFNNGSEQTADLPFENGKCYDRNGLNADIVVSGIARVPSTASSATVKVYTLSGDCVAEVADLHSASFILRPGIYVAGGRKFVVR